MAALLGLRTKSHPARGAWIEIPSSLITPIALTSHPARGAWIEIVAKAKEEGTGAVAPRKGCVD